LISPFSGAQKRVAFLQDEHRTAYSAANAAACRLAANMDLRFIAYVCEIIVLKPVRCDETGCKIRRLH
jgi:hypothetical protein